MDSRIPKPSAAKKPSNSSAYMAKTFDFSSFRLQPTLSTDSNDGTTETNSMVTKKPLSEINGDLPIQRRAPTPELVKSKTQPTKIRRSKSACDLRSIRATFDPLRGVKRPIQKTDVFPSKRLKPGPMSSKSSIKPPTQEKKNNAIAGMVKSGEASNVAKIVPKKPTTTVTAVSKAKVEVSKSVSTAKTKPTSKPIITRTASSSNSAKPSTATTATAAKKPVARVAAYDFKTKFHMLKEKYDELKETAEARKQSVEGYEEQIESLTSREQEYVEKIATLDELLKEKNDEIVKYEDEIKNLNKTCSNLNTKNTALASSLAQTSEELADAKVKIEKLEKVAAEFKDIKSKNENLMLELEESNSNLLKSREQLYTINAERMVLHNMVLDLRGNIRVFARVRPPLMGEFDRTVCGWAFMDEATLEITSNELVAGAKKPPKHEFSFDQVFDPNTTQDEIFDIVSPLIQSAMDGYNICIFAYGQTGSGKTYTMEGQADQPGIIPRTVKLLFNAMETASVLGWSYSVSVSFLEIYNEVLYDLLSNETKDIEIRMANSKNKTEIYVSNITIEQVNTAEKLYELMRIARSNRATAATAGNERSSRSHAVTRIEIVGTHRSKTEKLVGTINLVDLAGSESPKTSNRMDETKNINRSLSELSNVILSLVQKNEHIPYRNSKLTHLLMPSLGGNSKTLMFVNVSPLQDSFPESVKSLRFASQVNSCKLAKAKKNKQSSALQQSTSSVNI